MKFSAASQAQESWLARHLRIRTGSILSLASSCITAVMVAVYSRSFIMSTWKYESICQVRARRVIEADLSSQQNGFIYTDCLLLEARGWCKCMPSATSRDLGTHGMLRGYRAQRCFLALNASSC
ncbi:hypothetical protein BC832DRAFT_408817 [Gaertneriomyces semiglobifer]|nr:hypothetical protein BC832DRAFT_408817 [Gaertneriomyces semiglobifer]